MPMPMPRLSPFSFFFSCLSLCLATVFFSLFIFYSPSPLIFYSSSKRFNSTIDNLDSISIPINKGDENCDLFKGHWVSEIKGSSSLYTNYSCWTIPESKNCFLQGRKDNGFVNWRWKPDECDLPRFDPKKFLEMVEGKKLAFIGDSVARNHMESLLCLLSQGENPTNVYKDSEDRNPIWHFPYHNFTLIVLWTKYLVMAEERLVNGSLSGVYDVHLDHIDQQWTNHLLDLDYAIISDAHWFFRPLYLHQSNSILGCVYCDDQNMTRLQVSEAVGMALKSAFNYVNGCKKCKKGLEIILRTFSPAHFENGAWNGGGNCNRTSPFDESRVDLKSGEWAMRDAQTRELEIAKAKGEKRFKVLDITRAMLMRPDGHPGPYWGNKWMKDHNDCVHWCLPGPIDVWSDFLMTVIKEK